MNDTVVLDGELSLDVQMDGEFGIITKVGNEPTIESLQVTENGSYAPRDGVDGFSSVSVNVPSVLPVVNSLSINSNGVYTAPEGIDGYSPITVNVPSFAEHYKTVTLQEKFENTIGNIWTLLALEKEYIYLIFYSNNTATEDAPDFTVFVPRKDNNSRYAITSKNNYSLIHTSTSNRVSMEVGTVLDVYRAPEI